MSEEYLGILNGMGEVPGLKDPTAEQGANPTGSALVVIDMQNFFFAENTAVDVARLAANCRDIIEIGRSAALPIIHVVTRYNSDQSDWPATQRGNPNAWCSNLTAGNDLAAVIDGIDIRPEDAVVVKKRFSAFYNTNLDDVLRNKGCNHLYAIGYAGDVCVRLSLVDAYNRDYRVSIIEEGVESFQEPKERSLAYLEYFIDAERITLDGYRRMLRNTG